MSETCMISWCESQLFTDEGTDQTVSWQKGEIRMDNSKGRKEKSGETNQGFYLCFVGSMWKL